MTQTQTVPQSEETVQTETVTQPPAVPPARVPPTRRKVRDAADARECLEAQDASTMDLVAWCAANGVDGRSLNNWRLTLLGQGWMPGKGTLQLVELTPEVVVDRPRYVVRLGAAAIEVDERFDDRVLRRLLAVIATC